MDSKITCSKRIFDSKYPDWSEKISSIVPKLSLTPDTCQLYANFMVFVAILGVIPLAIQNWRVYKTKESRGISVYAFGFQIIISSLWILYAFMCRNGIIIISSSLIVIAAAVLVWLTIKYTSQSEESS